MTAMLPMVLHDMGWEMDWSVGDGYSACDIRLFSHWVYLQGVMHEAVDSDERCGAVGGVCG